MAEKEELHVDEALFSKRIKKFYDGWQEGAGWGAEAKATAIAVPAGTSTGELRYLKSTALQLWLFGYELPETVMVFTKEELHFLGSGKKAAFVQPLVRACEEVVGIKLVLHVKQKGDDGSKLVDAILDSLKTKEAPVVGVLVKEKPEGKLMEVWSKALEGSGLQTTDATTALAHVLSCKDKDEIVNHKRSAFLSSSVMKSYVVPQLEGIIDEEKKVKHRRIGEKIEEVISKPEQVNVKLKAENVDIAYPAIVQSGGNYDLRLSSQSSDAELKYDVVLCSLGSRYSMYCSNISRTYLVDPNKIQEAQYKALLEAQEAAIAALKPGKPMSDAYAAVVHVLEEKGHADLVAKMPKAIGFGMGIEFREAVNLLNAKNDKLVQPGMIFNVSVGVSDLHRSDADKGMASTYALLVADTILVPLEGGTNEVLTSACPKSWTDVAYFFKDEEDGKEEKAEAQASRRPALGDAYKKTNLRSENDTFKIQEEQRKRQKENQEDLLKRVNDETLRQLTRQKEGGGQAGGSGRKVSEVSAYRSVQDIPATRDMAIQVDQRNETVLLPIYGVMVPFHILTIKTVTNNQDGDHSYVRINFNFGPGFEPGVKFPQAIFLKEISFRSADTGHAAKVVQEIKLLRSAVSQREREQAERSTLVKQEKLIKAKGRMYTLPDVWIRPAFGGKGRKMTGTLEAHANGFRYISPKGESLDIMYRNIKHAFFQPAVNEMITLVHFHLVDPIMVGKKKTQDVQFYTEVMESVQTLDAGRRSMYDPDEIEEEQRERNMRNKINKLFEGFTRRVKNDVWDREFGDLELDFETPWRELGFHGVPHRQTAFVMPTVNCLVELIEVPFTVITMSEVNIVNLERVGFNLRNFDMTIVFKDLTRDVVRIDAIESNALESLRDWLGQMGIKFYESKINLNWKPILKSIMEDPEDFIENGGWSFLDQEGGSDEEEDEEEEGDVEFAPESGSEEEESSEDDESEDESVVDSDEEDSDDEEGSDEGDEEEEGLSWEELEEEAKREDKGKHYEEDSDEEDGKRRKGGGGGPRKRPRH